MAITLQGFATGSQLSALTNLSITLGGTPASGDTLICICAYDATTHLPTANSGWTIKTSLTANSPAIYVLYKQVGAGDSSTQTPMKTATSGTAGLYGAIWWLRGCTSSADPTDGANTAHGANTHATPIAPSITPSRYNDYVMSMALNNTVGTSWTTPTNYSNDGGIGDTVNCAHHNAPSPNVAEAPSWQSVATTGGSAAVVAVASAANSAAQSLTASETLYGPPQSKPTVVDVGTGTASSGNVLVVMPGGAPSNGDFLVAMGQTSLTGATLSVASGWTQTNVSGVVSPGLDCFIAIRKCDGTDTATLVPFTTTGGGTSACVVQRITGVNTTIANNTQPYLAVNDEAGDSGQFSSTPYSKTFTIEPSLPGNLRMVFMLTNDAVTWSATGFSVTNYAPVGGVAMGYGSVVSSPTGGTGAQSTTISTGGNSTSGKEYLIVYWNLAPAADGKPTALVSKLMTAALSFVGALASTTPGQHFTKALNATLSFSAAISNAISKKMTATGSFSAAISNAISKKMTATGSFTAAIAKSTTRSLTGALSFAGNAIASSRFTKTLAASLGFSGLLARLSSSKQSATLTSSGATTKAIAERKSGTLSFAGAMGRNLSKTLAAVISFVGSVPRGGQLFHSTLNGVVSFAGNVNQRVGALKTAAVSSSGAITHGFGRALTGSTSFSGAIKRANELRLGAHYSFTGVLRRSIAVSRSAEIGFVGTVAYIFLGTFDVTLNATISASGAFRKTVSRPFAAATAFVGSLSRQHIVRIVLNASVGLASTLGRGIRKAIRSAIGFALTLLSAPRLTFAYRRGHLLYTTVRSTYRVANYRVFHAPTFNIKVPNAVVLHVTMK